MTKNDKRKKAPDTGENPPTAAPAPAAAPPAADKVGNGEHTEPDVPSQPVTVAMLKTVLGEMSGAFETRIQQTEEMFDKKLNEQGAELQNAFKQWGESLVSQINEKIHPEAAQEQGGGGIDKDEIFQKILDKALNKYLGDEQPQPSGLDQMTILLRKAIDREAQKVALKSIRGALSKGTLFPEEVSEVLGEQLEHGPA